MVGIIDSGMGGLTTLSALCKAKVDHAYCYYADTRHAPYGNLPAHAIIEAAQEAAESLVARGADRIVLACNTATIAAKEHLAAALAVPIYGVTPALYDAQRSGGKTLLIATAYTAAHYKSDALLDVVALPRLAQLIDAHYPHLAPIEDYCRHALPAGPYDNLVIGCTHYLLVRSLLAGLTQATRTFDANEALAASLSKAPAGRGISVDILASGKVDCERYLRVLQELLA